MYRHIFLFNNDVRVGTTYFNGGKGIRLSKRYSEEPVYIKSIDLSHNEVQNINIVNGPISKDIWVSVQGNNIYLFQENVLVVFSNNSHADIVNGKMIDYQTVYSKHTGVVSIGAMASESIFVDKVVNSQPTLKDSCYVTYQFKSETEDRMECVLFGATKQDVVSSSKVANCTILNETHVLPHIRNVNTVSAEDSEEKRFCFSIVDYVKVIKKNVLSSGDGVVQITNDNGVNTEKLIKHIRRLGWDYHLFIGNDIYVSNIPLALTE